MHYYGIVGSPAGVDNATDCISNESLLSSMEASIGRPDGALGLIMNTAVTSSSSFSQRSICEKYDNLINSILGDDL